MDKYTKFLTNSGDGEPVDFKKTSKNQQKNKALSTHYAINLAMKNPKSPLKKAYDNSYHCANVKQYDGDKNKLISTYCKNKWCFVCNRIKTAVNVNRYAPVISSMGYPFFVTLTRPTVSIEDLPKQIELMEKHWKDLRDYAGKKNKKPHKSGIQLKGIRAKEITLRPNGQYHYHFHIIVDGWHNAEWIRSQWLERNSESVEGAQDVRAADSNSLMELFKYAIKISVNLSDQTNFERLDKVFQILHKKQMLIPFGLKVPKKMENDEFLEIQSQMHEELKIRLGNESSVWVWNQNAFDWVNKETGELLVGEDIPQHYINLIENGTPFPDGVR